MPSAISSSDIGLIKALLLDFHVRVHGDREPYWKEGRFSAMLFGTGNTQKSRIEEALHIMEAATWSYRISNS